MFSLPMPVTTQEAHSQAGELADKGEHLEAALRYLMIAPDYVHYRNRFGGRWSRTATSHRTSRRRRVPPRF